MDPALCPITLSGNAEFDIVGLDVIDGALNGTFRLLHILRGKAATPILIKSCDRVWAGAVELMHLVIPDEAAIHQVKIPDADVSTGVRQVEALGQNGDALVALALGADIAEIAIPYAHVILPSMRSGLETEPLPD